MADAYIGEIRPVPYTFAPVGWAMCDGSLINIADNETLFALLGTTYGGDGVTNFALPDLRGRVPVHKGQGNGLSLYVPGQVGGVESVTLLVPHLPQHNHGAAATSTPANTNSPVNNMPAISTPNIYLPTDGQSMAPDAIGLTGGGLPHENRQPSLGVTYIIALEGFFPPMS